MHVTYLFVWLFDTWGHWIGFSQGWERSGPEICDRCGDYRRDRLLKCSITIAMRAQQAKRAGWWIRWRWCLAQRLLWNTEEVHSEEDAPGQRWEEIDDLILGSKETAQRGVTPVHSSHQVTTCSAQAWCTQNERLKQCVDPRIVLEAWLRAVRGKGEESNALVLY